MRVDDHYLQWLAQHEGTASHEELTTIYRETVPIVYPHYAGFANLMIFLCDFFFAHPDGVAHESFRDYEVGRWLTFNFPTTSQTGMKNVYEPRVIINPFTIEHVHPLIRKLIRPSHELETLLAQHHHLIDGVRMGMHIRRGWYAEDCRSREPSEDGHSFANDAALAIFKEVAAREGGPIFLASDSPMTKTHFPQARTLDTTVPHHVEQGDTKDRRNVFVDFFLMSRCPRLLLTGGHFPTIPGISTFGYMAAQYGGIPYMVVENPKLEDSEQI